MRRGRIALFTAVALSGVMVPVALTSGPLAAAADPRPNIVMVMTDDQAAVDQRYMPQTTRLIGGTGTTFANAFATEPLCCPSRVSILTGQYSHNHGVLSNLPPLGSSTAFTGRDNTLPVWLDEAGYRTGFVGKYLNGPLPLAPEPGWDHWVSPTGSEASETRMYDYDLSVDGQVVRFGSTPDDYKTDVLTRYAQAFLSQPSAEPFALFLWDSAPHDANLPSGSADPPPAVRHEGMFRKLRFQRSPSYNEQDISDKATWNRSGRMRRQKRRNQDLKRRSRLESLQAVDEQVASLVSTLAATGELANTIFIFTSDNGYMYGEHRLGSKSRPYEESVRVPLLIRGPGFPHASARDDLVALHDLVPTIVRQANATPRRTLDGRDLLGPDRRRSILLECLACTEGGAPEGGWRMLRTRTQAFISYSDNQVESYDLRRDPWQMDAGLDPRSARLAERVSAVAACAGSSCP
jgi:arylsulfatase A-like enzyme